MSRFCLFIFFISYVDYFNGLYLVSYFIINLSNEVYCSFLDLQILWVCPVLILAACIFKTNLMDILGQTVWINVWIPDIANSSLSNRVKIRYQLQHTGFVRKKSLLANTESVKTLVSHTTRIMFVEIKFFWVHSLFVLLSKNQLFVKLK